MNLIETQMTESAEARDARHATMKLHELAAEYKAVREELERAEGRKSKLQKIADHLAKGVLPERMEEEGVEVVKLEGIGRLQIRADIYCSCPAANRDLLQEWLVDHGHSSLLSTSVNASTLKAFVKEQMKSGGDYPADLLSVTPYRQASIVKA